eukprot:scaffold1600_cov37-Prasinocladus_malaysianus.AAC.1
MMINVMITVVKSDHNFINETDQLAEHSTSSSRSLAELYVVRSVGQVIELSVVRFSLALGVYVHPLHLASKHVQPLSEHFAYVVA